MPLTKLRTSNLLSGSVDSGSLGPGSITGQVAATTVEDADLVLIYDNDATALRKMTRANFTAGLSTTLSGAYDAGTVITASKGPVDIQATNNTNATTTVLKLAVSGTVSGGGAAGPEILFTIPVSGESKVGSSIKGTKFASDANDSHSELRFSTSGNDENLDMIMKIDNTGVAVQGLGSSEVYPSSGYSFMVASSGETNAMVVEQTSGDVGIGLTNPLVPLHVYRSDTSVSPQISAQQGSTGDAGFFLSIPNASYMLGIDNSDSDKFKIAYGNSSTNATLNSNPRFVIDTTGRVGINKFDPEALLDIVDTSISAGDDFNAPENYHMFIEGSSTTDKYMGIGIGSTNDIGAAVLFQDKGSYSKGDLLFMTKESASNGVAPVERMRIRSDGEIVHSSSQLKITSAASASLIIEADTDNTTEADTAYIKLSQDGTAVQALIGFCPDNAEDPEGNAYTDATSNALLVGATKNFNLQLGTSNAVAMTISGSSGTNKGKTFLNATKDDTTASSANLFINSSTGFLQRSTSDRRQKKDVTVISSSLDDLCSLSPCHFYDINDENNEIKIAGFVADEVQTVFPALVPERDDPAEIYRSVAYDRLGAYIVSAIKELKQRLEALEDGE